MALSREEKQGITKAYAANPKDSGSTRVQVANLTSRINYLQDHFTSHPKDHHSRRGLMQLVGQRRRLLDYMKSKDIEGYRALIDNLNIRK